MVDASLQYRKNRDEYTLLLITGLAWFALWFMITGWAGGPECERAYFFVRDHPHNSVDTGQPSHYCSTDYPYLHDTTHETVHTTPQY